MDFNRFRRSGSTAELQNPSENLEIPWNFSKIVKNSQIFSKFLKIPRKSPSAAQKSQPRLARAHENLPGWQQPVKKFQIFEILKTAGLDDLELSDFKNDKNF